MLSEFAPRTGVQGNLDQHHWTGGFLIKDIAFIGTPGVTTDAFITLALNNIREATIRHCEFYGLSSTVEGGAIVYSTRSGLNIKQSVFLGSTGNSGVYTPVIQNREWKSINVTDAVFADWGQRPELYGKLPVWGHHSPGSTSAMLPPRRATRHAGRWLSAMCSLTRGALIGLASFPDRYLPPPSTPIDLFYVSGNLYERLEPRCLGHLS